MTVETDVDWIWLGKSTVFDLNRVVVPDPVIDWGLLDVDGRVYWAVDEADGVYLSNHRDSFADDASFRLVGDATLGGSQGVTVPAALFASASPAVQEVPVFERRETVGFVATETELESGVCRVVPKAVATERFGDLLSDD